MTLLISVVVPTFNRASLISQTLESILAQQYPPAEIIVVDDGSTDDIAATLQAKFPSVRLIAIANSGDLVARNVGLREARGDVVAFCDSDDLWRQDHLAMIAALWAAEPGLSAAFANFTMFGEFRADEPEKFATAPPGWFDGLRHLGDGLAAFDQPIADRLIDFTPMFPSAFAVARADFLAQGGWDETIGRPVSKDFATMLRAATRPHLGVILKPTVCIRKHAGNFSADNQKMNLGGALVLEHVLERHQFFRPFAEKIRKSVRKRRLDAMDIAFQRGDYSGVIEISNKLSTGTLPVGARVKCAVAALPAPLRNTVARGLLAAGSAKATVTRHWR